MCKVSSDFRTCLVHGSLACDKSNHTSRSHLIQRLCKEIIMDQEIVFIILLICHLILTKRYISDCHIKEIVRIIGLFKAFDLHICLRIKLFCNASGDTVKLYSVKPAFFHGIRHHTKKVADAHGRLQYISFGKSHFLQCFVHLADNDRTCVMGIQGTLPCHAVLLRR